MANWHNTLLNQRELKIITLFVKGSSIVHIARKLNLSESTVGFYLKNIKKKLQRRYREDLFHQVLESEILEKYLASEDND